MEGLKEDFLPNLQVSSIPNCECQAPFDPHSLADIMHITKAAPYFPNLKCISVDFCSSWIEIISKSNEIGPERIEISLNDFKMFN